MYLRSTYGVPTEYLRSTYGVPTVAGEPTMAWLREQRVPIIELDCSGTPAEVREMVQRSHVEVVGEGHLHHVHLDCAEHFTCAYVVCACACTCALDAHAHVRWHALCMHVHMHMHRSGSSYWRWGDSCDRRWHYRGTMRGGRFSTSLVGAELL